MLQQEVAPPPFYRPSRLTPASTLVWKTVDDNPIHADVFVPKLESSTDVHPVMLFIHGGGWVGGDRTDYSVAYFTEFLRRGCVVVSVDYRLLPETPFSGQLADIRDLDDWLRGDFLSEVKTLGYTVSTVKIIVMGASAGAHLALLTPKLWKKPPAAILSMYGPTKMYDLPYRPRGPFGNATLPPLTPDMIKQTLKDIPPTGIPPARSVEEFLTARSLICIHVFRQEIMAEFLLRGLVDGNLPTKGCVDRSELDDISPLSLCKKSPWPPTYQVIGIEDEIFGVDQVEDFDTELTKQGIPCKTVILDGQTHAFDIAIEIDMHLHKSVINPAVDWVIKNAISSK